MSALELTTFITFLANWIACNIDDDDVLALIGAELTQLGDTVTTISAQRQLCEKLNNKQDDTPTTDSV
ncbi:MAG: hypothetical protein FWF46_08920 [Oscillospiraceae bacterium]|nr:hypothetical protein [Oscillospiraceae bacterium]